MHSFAPLAKLNFLFKISEIFAKMLLTLKFLSNNRQSSNYFSVVVNNRQRNL